MTGTSCSRRNFLAMAGAAPAMAAAAGFDNPFFALCMDTHDAKKRSLEEQARMLKELGYAGAAHLWLDNVEERLATLDRAGLKLFQIYIRIDLGPKAKEAYDQRLAQVLPLLKGKGVQLAPLVIGGTPSDASLDERAAATVKEIAAAAAPYGVKVALYPHQKHWLETVQDGLRVAAKVSKPEVGVMFNLCHWLRVGSEDELRPLVRSAMPRLLSVSINGADRGAEIKAGTGKWIQPLGSGTFDMLGFLRELRDAGYRGPIGLQCYGIPGDAAVHLEQSMAAWRGLRKQLGSRS
jgi:sugar phosphate isomerase/epimerase